MKFVVDVNLPPRLARWLISCGHEAVHLADSGRLTDTDTEIWEQAKDQERIIVSKDCDFYDRVLIFGAPPQVFHIAVGNCSNDHLFELIQSQWSEIETALASGAKLICLSQEKIEVFS